VSVCISAQVIIVTEPNAANNQVTGPDRSTTCRGRGGSRNEMGGSKTAGIKHKSGRGSKHGGTVIVSCVKR